MEERIEKLEKTIVMIKEILLAGPVWNAQVDKLITDLVDDSD
jgi:hypothetical protein